MIRILLLILVFVSLPLHPGFAQEARLSIVEAITLGLQRNEVPEIAAARLQQAAADRQEALSAILPQLSLGASWVRRPELTREGFLVRPDSSRTYRANADLQLIDFAAVAGIVASNLALQSESFNSSELQRMFAIEVARSYLAVLSAGHLVSAAERRRDAAETSVSTTRKRVETGLAARTDLTRIELEQAAAVLALEQARDTHQRTQISLQVLLDDTNSYQLSEPAQPVYASESPDISDVLTTHPRLQMLGLQRDAAAASAQQPLYGFLPSLGVSGSWSQTSEADFSGQEDDWQILAGITWRVFDGGRKIAQRRRNYAGLSLAEAELSETRRRISGDIRQAKTAIRTAAVSIDHARLQLELAQRNAREVDLRMQSGNASGLEQADALATLHEAETDFIRRKLNKYLAELALVEADGRWPFLSASHFERASQGAYPHDD